MGFTPAPPFLFAASTLARSRHPAWFDEVEVRVVPIDSILVREHALRQALTHDDNQFTATAVGIRKIAPRDYGDAERREKSGRYSSEAASRSFFAWSADVAIHREFEAGSEGAR